MATKISRTISYSVISLTVFNMNEGMAHTEISVPGDYSKIDEKELLAEMREFLETDVIKILQAFFKDKRKEKRVMDLNDFIKYSHVATKEEIEAEKEEYSEKEGD